MMRVRTIPAAELSLQLLDRWRCIQQDHPAFASPYFCPEYTQLVAQVQPGVFVGVAEESQKVVGFFPFQRRRFGIGRPVGGPLSDYQAFVVEPQVQWSPADLIRQCSLTVWNFDHLLRCQSPFEPYVTTLDKSPILDLRQGYAAYRAQRRQATNRLNRVDAQVRKLAQAGPPLRYVAHSDRPQDLATLIRWKSAQYKRTGLINVFSFPWTTQLLQRVCATQTPRFAGMLSALYLGDRLIAVHLGMRSATVWHSWFPSFDREFEKYSLGKALLLKMAEDAANHGLNVLDLGRGESPYKTELANASIPLVQGSVALPSLARTAQRWRQGLEALVRQAPVLYHIARIPGRALRRAERLARFR